MRIIEKLFSTQINKAVAEQMANRYNETVFRWLNDGQPVMKPDDFDYIENGYLSVSAVYEAVDLIMKKIQSYPVLIKRLKGSKSDARKAELLLRSDNVADRAKGRIMKEKIYEEVSIPQIEKMLENPNSKQTYSDFIGMVVVNYLVTGNAYIYGNGAGKDDNKFVELFALPEQMKIVSGGTLDPVKEYVLWWDTDKERIFPANQVCHIRTVNPKYDTSGTQLYGISPLRAFLYDLYNDKFGNDALAKMLKNGGVISLITPKHKEDQFGDIQKKGLKESLVDAFSSSESYRRYVPSSIALEVTKVGLPPSDLQLLELTAARRKNIMHGAYHIPFSYIDNDQSTYNNAVTDGKRLMYDSVAPVCDVISQSLTKFIAAPYDKNLKIEIDWSSAYELADDLKQIMEWVKEAISIGMLTPDEGRSVIGWGETGRKEMREHYIGGNYKRLIDVGHPTE